MRSYFCIAILGILIFAPGCHRSNPVETMPSGLSGQVYAIGGPATTVPPPAYLKQSTIIVLDSTFAPFNEFATNDRGQFKIILSPGEYYLLVKESLIPGRTGPFAAVEGRIDTAFAYYDNGLK